MWRQAGAGGEAGAIAQRAALRSPRAGEPPWPRRGRRLSRQAAAAWPAAIPAAVTLTVMLWRIRVPSFWRDEAATLSAAHRSFPQLIQMLGHVDAVHGGYYVIMWPLLRLAGSGELVARLPSALAMAAAAGIITAIGRRLVSLRAGLASGLVFAVLPPVSWFGQDARPFAIETALACATSYLFIRAQGARPDHERRAWLGAYAVALAALGVMDLFGLLLAGAHAATLALSRGRRRDRFFRGWAVAVTVAGVAVAPLALLEWTERSQINWLNPPGLPGVLSVGRLAGPRLLDIAVVVIVAAGIAVAALAGRIRLDWPGRLPALCLPWLLLPAAILLTASLLRPVYTFRYIVFCIPAMALLVGAALAALGRAAGPAGLVLIVLLGLPAQLGERGPAGHSDGIRQIDLIIAEHDQPGDGVLYLGAPGTRSFAAAYPFGLARLRDVALARTPAQSGTLSGTNVPPATLRDRLSHISRVWVAEPDGTREPAPVPILRGTPFRLLRTWHVTDIWLRLYAKPSPAPPSNGPALPPRRA